MNSSDESSCVRPSVATAHAVPLGCDSRLHYAPECSTWPEVFMRCLRPMRLMCQLDVVKHYPVTRAKRILPNDPEFESRWSWCVDGHQTQVQLCPCDISSIFVLDSTLIGPIDRKLPLGPNVVFHD